MSDIDWDAIGELVERKAVGARAWTFNPTATVEANDDGTFTITLEWTDSYDGAWDSSWKEMEDPDQYGAHILDQLLSEQPRFKGELVSHWLPSEETQKSAARFTCDVCGRSFNTDRGLSSHRGQVHK